MKPKDLAIFVYGSKTDNQTGNKLPLCLAGLELPIGTQRLIHILEPNQAMIINTHTQWVQQIKSLLTQTTPVMLHIQHDNSQILNPQLITWPTMLGEQIQPPNSRPITWSFA